MNFYFLKRLRDIRRHLYLINSTSSIILDAYFKKNIESCSFTL